MNISPPPTLSPVKARSGSSHLCPTTTSKLLRIILSIGAVGLLLINQNFQGYDDTTSPLDGSVAVMTPSAITDGDENEIKDRQLRKPTQTVVEEPQLDFAVVGFEKTVRRHLLDVHIICVMIIISTVISVHFTANNSQILTFPIVLSLSL